jgi:hypothetical protein
MEYRLQDAVLPNLRHGKNAEQVKRGNCSSERRLWNLLNYLEKHVVQAQALGKRDPMLESLDTLICPV